MIIVVGKKQIPPKTDLGEEAYSAKECEMRNTGYCVPYKIHGVVVGLKTLVLWAIELNSIVTKKNRVFGRVVTMY